jgi:inosine-uridine nucleoside N-ribohydrolase
VRGSFVEGFPNITAKVDVSAAQFMVEQVRKYPGKVSIFAAGALTNIALAVRMDSKFAGSAKELVLMGGYVDDNLFQVRRFEVLIKEPRYLYFLYRRVEISSKQI